MVLNQKRVAYPIQVEGESMPEVEEFLGVLFMSAGRMEHEINKQISAAAAIMWTLHWFVLVK